jgi:hypothetical protein
MDWLVSLEAIAFLRLLIEVVCLYLIARFIGKKLVDIISNQNSLSETLEERFSPFEDPNKPNKKFNFFQQEEMVRKEFEQLTKLIKEKCDNCPILPILMERMDGVEEKLERHDREVSEVRESLKKEMSDIREKLYDFFSMFGKDVLIALRTKRKETEEQDVS